MKYHETLLNSYPMILALWWVLKVKNDHHSIFSNLSNWKEQAWKISGILLFRLLLSSCLNWKIYCDDHSSLSSTSAVWTHLNYLIYMHVHFTWWVLLACKKFKIIVKYRHFIKCMGSTSPHCNKKIVVKLYKLPQLSSLTCV